MLKSTAMRRTIANLKRSLKVTKLKLGAAIFLKQEPNIYITNEYTDRNPTLHEEDSPWKLTKIIPMVDLFMQHYNGKEINLLDVGGGAGLILKEVSSYLSSKYLVNVKKFSIDLNKEMLQKQKERNSEDTEFLRGDIKKAAITDKQMDLTLLIDVLEHIPNPEEALKELQRITKFVILKVPLENYLIFNIANKLTKGSTRQKQITNYGHINVYSSKKIKKDVRKQMTKIIAHKYTNLHQYYRSQNYKKLATFDKAITVIATKIFHLSPRLAASLFGDNSILLVKC